MKIIFLVILTLYAFLKKIILVPCRITVAISLSLYRKFLNIKIPLFCHKEYIRSSIGLIFVFFISILLTAGLIFIASKTQPGSIDCHVYNETKLKSGSEFNQIPHSLEIVPMTSRSHLSECHHIADHVSSLMCDGDDRLAGRELVDSLLHFHVEESSPKVFSSDD
ncbi:hypothetical protein JTE90_001843 [Oedothorax gibbosus]|uniref:Uncharacterized protein n=1 Tax=Oedothorax gibbosus TaxID=931172 RepID=A0AAV6VQJ8_9ARAC|nr:hypothetical protein JTE90_001843 [Oedothorax gibbosus]